MGWTIYGSEKRKPSLTWTMDPITAMNKHKMFDTMREDYLQASTDPSRDITELVGILQVSELRMKAFPTSGLQQS